MIDDPAEPKVFTLDTKGLAVTAVVDAAGSALPWVLGDEYGGEKKKRGTRGGGKGV